MQCLEKGDTADDDWRDEKTSAYSENRWEGGESGECRFDHVKFTEQS